MEKDVGVTCSSPATDAQVAIWFQSGLSGFYAYASFGFDNYFASTVIYASGGITCKMAIGDTITLNFASQAGPHNTCQTRPTSVTITRTA
jgi:hypothetical protein